MLVLRGNTNEGSVLEVEDVVDVFGGAAEALAVVFGVVAGPGVELDGMGIGRTVPKARGNGSARTARLLGGSTTVAVAVVDVGRRHSAIEYLLFEMTIPPLPSALVEDELSTPSVAVARVLLDLRRSFNIRFLTVVAKGITEFWVAELVVSMEGLLLALNDLAARLVRLEMPELTAADLTSATVMLRCL